jgi:hypothetical protein
MNIQLEPHVLTPYFYPRLNIDLLGCTEEGEPNYNEYHLFCLRTRLGPFLEKQDLAQASVEFIPVQRGIRFYIGIRLTDAGVKISLNSKKLRLLEDKIKEITTVQQKTCLLYSAETEVYINRHGCRQKISPLWILSVLPYLPIDPLTNPYVDETHLFVDLSIYPDYNTRYEEMYTQIETTLREYYRRGMIVCNATFAQRWQLVPYILLGISSLDNEEEMDEDEAIAELTDSNGLYEPVWEDVRFAPDRVSFLLERMAGEKIVRVKLNPTPEKKAAIASFLKGRRFLFDHNTLLLLDMTSLDEIRRLVSQVANVPSQQTIITPLLSVNDLPPEQEVSYWQDLSGKSYFATNAVMFSN